MIHVTRLNHSSVVLNSDLIEQIESTPDTVISLVNGERIMVLETPDEVVDRVVGFRRLILCPDAMGGLAAARRPLGEYDGRR